MLIRNRRVAVARGLRRRMTDAERKLWSKIRNRQLRGLKFKRQVPVGGFVADFACLEHHLVVEVDGGQHNFSNGIARDTARTRELEAMGYVVLRFWNVDVLKNIDGVLETLLAAVEPPHPVPLPPGERGPAPILARAVPR